MQFKDDTMTQIDIKNIKNSDTLPKTDKLQYVTGTLL